MESKTILQNCFTLYICMYVCVCICMYACVCVCKYVYNVYACMYVCICMCSVQYTYEYFVFHNLPGDQNYWVLIFNYLFW